MNDAVTVAGQPPATDPGPCPGNLPEVVSFLRDRTVRILSSETRSSGTLVSPDGLILTTAHGIREGSRSVQVIHHRRGVLTADLVWENRILDAAALQIRPSENSDPSDWPFIVVAEPDAADAKASAESLPVLAAGCPGRDAHAVGPLVRLGTVTDFHRSLMRSTARLTVGDSGGPLTTTDGILIAIHRRIGLQTDSNLHVPVTNVLDRMLSDLRQRIAASDRSQTRDPQPIAQFSKISHRQLQLQLLTDSAGESDQAHPDEPSIGTESAPLHALRVSAQYCVTQRSLLRPSVINAVVRIPAVPAAASPTDDHRWKNSGTATLVYSDQASDLSVWKLDLHDAAQLPPVSDGFLKSGSELRRGSPIRTFDGRVGIMGDTDYSVPSDSGKLGCRLDQRGEAVIVTEVSPHSAAARAGLVTGDSLSAVNGNEVRSVAAAAEALQPAEPGDWVRLSFSRPTADGVILTEAECRLDQDPRHLLDRSVHLDGAAGNLSRRRSGLRRMLRHDIAVTPNDSGIGLFTCDGRLAAMQLSVVGRESAVAVAINDVLRVVQKASAR